MGYHGKMGGLALLALLAAGSSTVAQQPESAACQVPLNMLAPADANLVKAVLDQATLTTRGVSEVFTCKPEQYVWLLDHPDLASRLWRCLGVKCADIVDRGNGIFTWNDDKGSMLQWREVYRDPHQRVLYAHGKVNPGVLLPTSAVQAVLVIHHTDGTTSGGKAAVRHQVDMTIHTDSQVMAAGARLLGASAPHLAQQYIGQIQTFYGALAWYLNQHPSHAEVLSGQLAQPRSTDRKLALPAE